MLREGRIVGRDGAGRPACALPAAGVPVVPPRPARRGAGALRRGRPAPRRRRASWWTSRTSWPTIPRGRHVVETALVRLRRELDLPELSPAHRLDRVTAGVLLFVVRRERRGAYQTLFRDRRVHKTYEAVAPYDPGLPFPQTVRSRIVKERGVILAREVPGPPNARDPRRAAGAPRRPGALPAHPADRPHPPAAAAPARPRAADPRRPVLRHGIRRRPEPEDTALDDWTRPLQLLATTLELPDPVDRRAAAVHQPPHTAGLDRPRRLGGGSTRSVLWIAGVRSMVGSACGHGVQRSRRAQ